MDHYDVIVIGIGAMGSAACYQLAWRKARVLGIDRFDIPNTMGSSHGLSRMIRSAYYEHPNYVPLLRRSFELWHEVEQASGQKLLHLTGGLYIGRPDDPFIAGSLHSAKVHQLPHELLDAADLQSRFPQFHLPPDRIALFEHQAGLLLPERCITAHIELARARGTEIHSNETILEWHTDGRGASVTTDRASYNADQLIITAGPWTDKLVRDLGVPLVVTRQVLGWVQPLKPDLFQLGQFPVWAIGNENGSIHYGFPILPDGHGFKLAHHHPGRAVDPETVDRIPNPQDEQEFRPVLRQFIPDADGPLKHMRICLYTNSPDHHFIIDRHPAHPRLTIACGFSGHGFKFASVIGELLADLATTGHAAPEAEFLSLGRFIPSN